uniref:Uncharacterized protein n=1 Tax=Zea mays TaxID=4577 RepID=B4FPX2_MAIZE|nr:unknown [Zea mays]
MGRPRPAVPGGEGVCGSEGSERDR